MCRQGGLELVAHGRERRALRRERLVTYGRELALMARDHLLALDPQCPLGVRRARRAHRSLAGDITLELCSHGLRGLRGLRLRRELLGHRRELRGSARSRASTAASRLASTLVRCSSSVVLVSSEVRDVLDLEEL